MDLLRIPIAFVDILSCSVWQFNAVLPVKVTVGGVNFSLQSWYETLWTLSTLLRACGLG